MAPDHPQADAGTTDALFAVPPAEFVAARDRLAGELRKAGRKEEAAAIKAWKRPSASVWAVNQLARREAAALQRLVRAAATLERAQAAGGGADEGRRAYREALAEQREAEARLLEEARNALEEAGLGANRAVLDKVSNNLRWGVVAEPARSLLAEGRLTEDLSPPDLSALLERLPLPPSAGRPQAPRAAARGGMAIVPVEPRRAPAAHDTKHDTRKGGAGEARSARQEQHLAALGARLAAAEKELESARKEVRAAEAAGARAQEAVARAQRELTRHEADAAKAAATLAAAERVVAKHSEVVERLDAEIAQAKKHET